MYLPPLLHDAVHLAEEQPPQLHDLGALLLSQPQRALQRQDTRHWVS